MRYIDEHVRENQLRSILTLGKFPNRKNKAERSWEERESAKEKLIRFCRMTEMEFMSKNCRLDFTMAELERERERERVVRK